MTDTISRAQTAVEGEARALRTTLTRIRLAPNSSLKTLYIQSLERAVDALDGTAATLRTAQRMAERYGDAS